VNGEEIEKEGWATIRSESENQGLCAPVWEHNLVPNCSHKHYVFSVHGIGYLAEKRTAIQQAQSRIENAIRVLKGEAIPIAKPLGSDAT
jgi:hypothetical protein